MCLKHIPLYEDVPAVTHESFASVPDLSQEGSGYIEAHSDGIGNVVLWNVCWHFMFLHDDPVCTQRQTNFRCKSSQPNCMCIEVQR